LKYVYRDFVFVNGDNKSILYKDGRLLFQGSAWAGINIFLNASGNAFEVQEMFRSQLDQREEIKLRAEAKKPKEPMPPEPEEPEKKKVIRRPGSDRRMVR